MSYDGQCECGCGRITSIAKWSDRTRGYVRGEHKRFVQGHQIRALKPDCPKCGLPKAPGQSYCAEHMQDAQRSSYQRHRAKRVADTMAWKAANREKANAQLARWAKRNPDQAREIIRRANARRRARMRDAFVEDVDGRVVYQRDRGICGICDHPVDYQDFHVDHIIPLARGGEHSYANVQVAHPLCNVRKNAKCPTLTS